MQCINNSCAPCQCGPGQFCHNGVCGGCETNSECEPLICYSGTCGACGSDSQCESAFGLNTGDEDVGDCYNYEGGGGGGGCVFYEGEECGTCGAYDCFGDCEDSCAGGGGGGGGGGLCDSYQCGMAGGVCDGGECVADMDPIIVDLTGDGFSFTNAPQGISFDFFGNHKPFQMAWTTVNSGTAWLALDRNGNGRIDNGHELFSNVTPQDKALPFIGFKALAQYDLKQNGGNGDGVIDANDKIWTQLLLWEDKNHNGISEPSELTAISKSGITSISLNYQQKPWTDLYGNQFKYRAKITGAGKSGNDKWAYDVILTYVKK